MRIGVREAERKWPDEKKFSGTCLTAEITGTWRVPGRCHVGNQISWMSHFDGEKTSCIVSNRPTCLEVISSDWVCTEFVVLSIKFTPFCWFSLQNQVGPMNEWVRQHRTSTELLISCCYIKQSKPTMSRLYRWIWSAWEYSERQIESVQQNHPLAAL